MLGAPDMHGVVIVCSVAYGDGRGGIPGLLLDSPRDDAGNLIMLGTGQQHWSTVHVASLADAFRRVLEDDSARGCYVTWNEVSSTVAEAAAVAAAAARAVPGSDEEARARLGIDFAGVLLLDQGTEAAKARAELGWRPSSLACRRVAPRQPPKGTSGSLIGSRGPEKMHSRGGTAANSPALTDRLTNETGMAAHVVAREADGDRSCADG